MLHLLQDEQARRRAKNNRKKVLCPYCHQHFLLGEVVFRSSKAVDHLFDSKKSVEEDVFYNTWKKRGWIGLGEQQVTDKEHNKDDKKPRFMCEDRRNKCYYEAEAETDNSVRVDNVHFRIIAKFFQCHVKILFFLTHIRTKGNIGCMPKSLNFYGNRTNY